MKKLYLIGLILLMGCSTLKNVNDSLTKHINPAVDSIKSASDSLIPAANSVQIASDQTTLLESNALFMVSDIRLTVNQANSTLVTLQDETKKTLEELRLTLSNSTVMIKEARQAVNVATAVMSNDVPKFLTQATKTLHSIRATAVSVHKTQDTWNKIIMDNKGKIIIGVVGLIILMIFHSLIQRLILGKR